MTLQQTEIDHITDQVKTDIKSHLGEWMAEYAVGRPAMPFEMEIRERIVRVEEEFKHQRELMLQGFALIEKRIALAESSTLERFDAAEKRSDERFGELKSYSDARFDDMGKRSDARFDAAEKRSDERFGELKSYSNALFDAAEKRSDERFKSAEKGNDKQFNAVINRLEALEKSNDARFSAQMRRIDRFMIWSFSTTFAAAGIVITVLRLWR